MRIKSRCLLAVITAIMTGTVAGCSGQTEARLTVDLLSFLKSDEKVAKFWLPPFGTYQFYFLPGVQLDDTGAGPDKVQARGMVLDLPAGPGERLLSGTTVAFSGEIAVRNLNPSGILQLVRLSVLIAPADAVNIYEEGVEVASVPVDPIGPGGSAAAVFGVEISEGSPLAEIIEIPSIRFGMKLTYPETTGAIMKAGFELAYLEFSVSGRPFLLLQK